MTDDEMRGLQEAYMRDQNELNRALIETNAANRRRMDALQNQVDSLRNGMRNLGIGLTLIVAIDILRMFIR